MKHRPNNTHIPLFMDDAISLKLMIGENWQLVTNEPVEVQDCRKITHRFQRIYRIYPNLIKENRRMSTCNRLD